MLSLIKEGSPDEVTEQFYNIYESLSGVFEEDEGYDEGSSDDTSSDDASSDDTSSDDTQSEGANDDSFITEGIKGYDQPNKVENKYNLKNILKSYANI